MHSTESQLNAFLADYRYVYAPATYVTLSRQLRKINRELSVLKDAGVILTNDYQDMTPEDVKEYGVYLRNKGLSQSAIVRDLGGLKKLCNYFGNSAVDRARAQYPLLFFSPGKPRLPPLSHEEYETLITCISAVNNPFTTLRAAAIVGAAVGAGLRPVELVHLLADDVDVEKGLLTVHTVKGGLTYGQPRTAPIRPSVRPILSRYIAQRATAPPTIAQSKFFFCNPYDGGALASNTLRLGKSTIEKMSGVKFDFRKLRRTYAQLALDEGAGISSVSLVLGHTNTRTTEDAYGRLRPDMAVADVAYGWGERLEVGPLDQRDTKKWLYERK